MEEEKNRIRKNMDNHDLRQHVCAVQQHSLREDIYLGGPASKNTQLTRKMFYCSRRRAINRESVRKNEPGKRGGKRKSYSGTAADRRPSVVRRRRRCQRSRKRSNVFLDLEVCELTRFGLHYNKCLTKRRNFCVVPQVSGGGQYWD